MLLVVLLMPFLETSACRGAAAMWSRVGCLADALAYVAVVLVFPCGVLAVCCGRWNHSWCVPELRPPPGGGPAVATWRRPGRGAPLSQGSHRQFFFIWGIIPLNGRTIQVCELFLNMPRLMENSYFN